MANFTEEQVAQLAQNKNVAWVSKAGVQFTAEFKLLAWEQKQQGKRMREILRENGIDPDMLGRKRIENLSMRVNDLAARAATFRTSACTTDARRPTNAGRTCRWRTGCSGSRTSWRTRSRKWSF